MLSEQSYKKKIWNNRERNLESLKLSGETKANNAFFFNPHISSTHLPASIIKYFLFRFLPQNSQIFVLSWEYILFFVSNFVCIFLRSTGGGEMLNPGVVGGSSNSDPFPAGLRVLVVDDDPTCLMILERMLRTCLYRGTLSNFCFSFFFYILISKVFRGSLIIMVVFFNWILGQICEILLVIFFVCVDFNTVNWLEPNIEDISLKLTTNFHQNTIWID